MVNFCGICGTLNEQLPYFGRYLDKSDDDEQALWINEATNRVAEEYSIENPKAIVAVVAVVVAVEG